MKSVTFAIMFRWPINSSFMFLKLKFKIKNYLFPIMVGVPCLVVQSCPTLCNSMDYSPPHCSVLGDSPGRNTGVGCRALLQGIFATQGSNPGLPQVDSSLSEPPGKPMVGRTYFLKMHSLIRGGYLILGKHDWGKEWSQAKQKGNQDQMVNH